MQAFTARLVRNAPGLLTTQIARAAEKLVTDVEEAAKTAASTAQQTSRSKAKYVREGISAPRKGRPTTGGKFGSHIKWGAKDGQVKLDVERLTKEARYWQIQEIGTGERAQMKRGDGDAGARLGRGRPVKDDKRIVSVRSQRGRVIKAGLVWGNRGRYFPSMVSRYRKDQIVPVSTVNSTPFRFPPRVVIGREIEGKHFVRDGAQAGFRQYETSVLAAARRAFPGRK